MKRDDSQKQYVRVTLKGTKKGLGTTLRGATKKQKRMWTSEHKWSRLHLLKND